MGNAGEEARYRRAVERVTIEACWLSNHQTALIALSRVTSPGLDFFHVVRIALLGDRLIRLVRVFDKHRDVTSLWYLHRCNPKGVEQAIVDASGSVEQLQDFSRRLK